MLGFQSDRMDAEVNLVAVAILSRGKCGLSICSSRYLVAMATADLMAVTTAVVLRRISYYFPGSFLDIYPVCSIIFVVLCISKDCSVWFTVTFTFDRFAAICCQKLKTKYCTGKTAVLVLMTTCALICFKNVPYYFIHKPGTLINNVFWFCKLRASYYTEQGWVAFDSLDRILTPLIPFALILLLNFLTVRHILLTSRVRKALRGQSKGDNRSDPEMESRRRSVILLFSISGSFILLWLSTVINFLNYNISQTDPNNFSDSEYILDQAAYMLQNLNCCTNTFIYGVTQAKFREQFISAGKYPVTSLLRFINKLKN
ncbi:probable G-protein coupled receptor 139 [Hypanus sabinus]|uniref:probable G-protein coupled receptor 139 n=1 Tax=Hypanus sabinus TaxID=79690 RepID=UPI0028C407C2|nr:probable G-protein coupled receptor 139 [Hypanus sabinus]